MQKSLSSASGASGASYYRSASITTLLRRDSPMIRTSFSSVGGKLQCALAPTCHTTLSLWRGIRLFALTVLSDHFIFILATALFLQGNVIYGNSHMLPGFGLSGISGAHTVPTK